MNSLFRLGKLLHGFFFKVDLALNLLRPKSDQHEIFPSNINSLENGLVMRIEYMIREDESN